MNGEIKKWVYRVSFNEPPMPGSDNTEFFFSSLAAIYDRFTPEQIGCKVTRLWNIGVSKGKKYGGRRCTIVKESVFSKPHFKPI